MTANGSVKADRIAVIEDGVTAPNTLLPRRGLRPLATAGEVVGLV